MTLKLYRLTLASRQLIINVLGSLEDLSGDVPHKVRTIRKTFELKDVEKYVDKLQQEIDEPYQVELIAWNNAKKAAEEKGQSFSEKMPVQRPLNWDDLAGTEEKKFTIDNLYADWLKEVVKSHNWRIIKNRQTGQDQEINISVDHICAIADLEDALAGEGIPRKPEKKESKE